MRITEYLQNVLQECFFWACSSEHRQECRRLRIERLEERILYLEKELPEDVSREELVCAQAELGRLQKKVDKFNAKQVASAEKKIIKARSMVRHLKGETSK